MWIRHAGSLNVARVACESPAIERITGCVSMIVLLGERESYIRLLQES
jgi:hypothetical protein